MKRSIILLFFSLMMLLITGMPVIATGKPLAMIRIKNTSLIERKDELVEIKFSELSVKTGGKPFKLIETVSRKEVAYQLEYKGTDKPQHVLVQIKNLKPGSEIVFEVLEGEPVKTEIKTFARFVPERKDDFAWENDVVAFRMYGKALETAPDNAWGTDIWTKRTDKLVVDKWYKDGEYHTDKGEGMDYYQVGLTLGGGDIAPYLKDSIWFSKNYHTYKIFDNGPFRSTFQLGYDNWKVGDMTMSVTKTISLDAGSQMNRVEVKYTIQGANGTDAVAGIVKRKDPGTMLLDEKNNMMAYWEPEVAGNGITGIGIIHLLKVKEMKVTDGHLLSRVSVQNNEPVVYYNGGAWNKAGKIKSAEEWFKYLSDFKYCLSNPLKVEIL